MSSLIKCHFFYKIFLIRIRSRKTYKRYLISINSKTNTLNRYGNFAFNYITCIIFKNNVICSGGRGFEPHGVRDVFSFSVWAHFLSRELNAQKELFGILLEHFNFKPIHIFKKACLATHAFSGKTQSN